MTTKQIAEAMGKTKEGVTKNAVIGKISRMGLNQNNPPRKPKKYERKVQLYLKTLKFKSFPAMKIDESIYTRITEHSVTLIDAEPKHCRWPLNNPELPSAMAMCCGLSISIGSYCSGHAVIAYEVSKKPKCESKHSDS